MRRVDVFHWNPRQPVIPGRIGRKIPVGKRVNNFGDLLGPVVVNRLLHDKSLSASSTTRADKNKLLAIGSVLHFARDNDVIWGSGINGKVRRQDHRFSRLDVRAVRGPVTRDFLLSLGIQAPPIFGDPGLLVGHYWSREELAGALPTRGVTVVPNFHDVSSYQNVQHNLVDPRTSLWSCIEQIAASEFVVGSSLHGIVIAESLGIPARLILPTQESMLKYEDYYRGTGRTSFLPARNVSDAVSLGGEPKICWDAENLLDAFPWDLWRQEEPYVAE